MVDAPGVLVDSTMSKDSALCPEIFSGTWTLRKEHYTGRELSSFISALPGYKALTKYFASQAPPDQWYPTDSYDEYLADTDYGFTEQHPGWLCPKLGQASSGGKNMQIRAHRIGTPSPARVPPRLFGAIVVRSVASCPRVTWRRSHGTVAPCIDTECDPGKLMFKDMSDTQCSGRSCSGDWDIEIHLNTTGPSTSTADIKGATDINTKLIPEVNRLNKGLSMEVSRIFWSGGLTQSLGLGLPTGGLVDLQTLAPRQTSHGPGWLAPDPTWLADAPGPNHRPQVLVFIWPLTRIMKSLVEDKEAKINEVMKMMGMPADSRCWRRDLW
eukprot:Skav202860  [mRNA]  locus=scaffold3206:19657:32602:- [translate_table: standard]